MSLPLNITWQTVLAGAGAVIKEVASAFGPIPGAVATFAVDAVTGVITAAEGQQDLLAAVENIEDQLGTLLENLKTGSSGS